jgi:hypothetical protein
MTNLFETLVPEAREDLLRHGIIELVSVTVMAVPDPARPEDRLKMKIAAEVNDNFLSKIPTIDPALDRADEICSLSEDDLSLSLKNELLVTLGTRRDELADLKKGLIHGEPAASLADPVVRELIRPSLEHPIIDARVWSRVWCAVRDDEGRLLVYCENPYLSEHVDDESWVRIQDRIRRVNYHIAGMMAELLGEVREVLPYISGGSSQSPGN